MRSLVNVAHLRQAGLPLEVPEGNDTVDRIHETVVGVVTAVYPVDHPKNHNGQLQCDVQISDKLPALRHVPLSVGYAHGETAIATANTRDRQPYKPKPRNQMDGAVHDVRPGTRVLLQFLSGDLGSPIIIGTVKFNRQGEHEGQDERQGEDRFADDGHYDMVEVHPVDSGMATYPRARDSYNGSAFTRDNRGNIGLQSTIDQEPVFPGHNEIPAAPSPQGNILASTRGAKVGRQGRITGQHPITGDAGDGTIRDETINATKGNWIGRLRSKVGRLWFSTRGSDDGRVYLENGKRSHMALSGDKATLHGAATAVLDALKVCLGNDNPPYHAVLYEALTEFITTFVETYDSHTHGGVESGDSNTDPPNQTIGLIFALLYQLGDKWKSDHVMLVKDEDARPTFEGDPDGRDDGGDQAPPPPAPLSTGPTKQHRKGAVPYGVYGGGGHR